jgi:hypothetical protein
VAEIERLNDAARLKAQNDTLKKRAHVVAELLKDLLEQGMYTEGSGGVRINACIHILECDFDE